LTTLALVLFERIRVAPDGISVTLHAAGSRSVIAELVSEQAAAPGARPRSHDGGRRLIIECARHEVGTLTIRIPMRLQRRGGRKLILIPERLAVPAPSRRDDTLIKALVRAHRWRQRSRAVARSRLPI